MTHSKERIEDIEEAMQCCALASKRDLEMLYNFYEKEKACRPEVLHAASTAIHLMHELHAEIGRAIASRQEEQR